MHEYLSSPIYLFIITFTFSLISDLSQCEVQMDFGPIDQDTNLFIRNRTFPGTQFQVFSNNKSYYEQAYGRLTYQGELFDDLVTHDTLYDLASLSKVISTNSAVMKLYEQGRLALDDKLIQYVPNANSHGKDKITIRNLLLHNAGLIPDMPGKNFTGFSEDDLKQYMYNLQVTYPIGSKCIYSDFSFMFLQLVVERITKMTLDQYAQKNIFNAMEMTNTMYHPPLIYQAENRCAPTTIDFEWRAMTLRCVVHDPKGYVFSGVSGSAGLFSTSRDIKNFMQMMLNKGIYVTKEGKQIQIFYSSTVEMFTTTVKDLPYYNTRCLGWDSPDPDSYPASSGQRLSQNSFGHTGYTGNVIYGDKDKNLGIISLTNRVYPNDGMMSSSLWYRNNLMNTAVDIVQGKHENQNCSQDDVFLQ